MHYGNVINAIENIFKSCEHEVNIKTYMNIMLSFWGKIAKFDKGLI